MLSSKCGTAPEHAPQKLSKPPTNTSSSNLLVPSRQKQEPTSPLTASDDSTDGYFPNMLPQGERRERRNTRSKIKCYLYGPSPESGHSHSSDDDESSPRRFADVVKRRLSRTDSAISQSLTVGAASAGSSTSRLNLPDTSSSDLDEHDAVKEQIREKVWIDSLAAQNHVSAPVDEDKHPDSMKSPIRRRSLYTPGIATRSPEDILRKPPPPEQIRSQADRDYYYNPALPDSSPLSRLVNLRSPPNGRSTPSELDYSHLGALQLGTLRVTNGGTASPVPCEQDTNAAPTPALDVSSCDNSYEPSHSDTSEPDGCLTMGDLARDSWPRSYHTPDGTEATSAKAIMYTVARPNYISPDRKSHSRRGSGTGSFTSIQSFTASQNPIKRKPLPAMSAAIRYDRSGGATPRPVSGLYGEQYMVENKPYIDGGTSQTQTLQADTTEHRKGGLRSNEERQADGWTPYSPNTDQLHATEEESREDAFMKLTKNQGAQERLSDVHDTYRKLPREFSFDQQHVDSGYSSNVSLESTQIRTPKVALESRIPSGAQVLLQSPCRRHLQSSRDSTPTRYSQVSELSRINTQLDHGSPRMSNMQSRPIADTEEAKSLLSVGPERSAIQKQPTSPEKPRRLQKKRPKSQPPLHRTPMLSNSSLSSTNIPPVPTGIAALHSERVTQLPSMEHGYSDVDDTDAFDMPVNRPSMTAQTRFPSPMHESMDVLPKDRSSMFQRMAMRARSRSRSRPRVMPSVEHSDDESVKSDIMRSPSWSDYGNTKKKEQRKLAKAERELQKQKERESSCDPDARSRSKSRSRSRFRSRSRKRSSQVEPVPTLTDFGTVSESLGAGPYDIAIASHTPNYQSPRNQLQPYQITTAKRDVDPTPALSMQSYGRGRNRSHTSATVALSEGLSDGNWALPKPDRPRSMYFESRPVPAVAMLDLTKRRSALSQHEGQGMTICSQMINTTQQAPTTVDPTPQPDNEAMNNTSVELENESKSAPSNDVMTNEADTMEALVDKLLEAPNHEAREILLQQMRELRHRSTVPSKTASQQVNKNRDIPSLGDAERSLSHSTPSRSTPQGQQQAQEAQTTEAGGSKVVKVTATDHNRNHNMFVDAPPMPPLPTAKDIQEQETRRSIEQQSRRSKTLVGPQMPAPEPSRTDLWAGCAIQTEHRKAIESSNAWDAHRLAWSRRRKSAGEALLVQNRSSGTASPRKSVDMSRMEERPRGMSRAMTAGLEQPTVAKDSQKAFHKPWAPTQDQDAPAGGPTGALQSNSSVAATAQTFERRSGRYEGGLLFGYEPGFGMGGSAGTRSTTKTGATRKSLQMSQGYGVDLSDVPIFVASS